MNAVFIHASVTFKIRIPGGRSLRVPMKFEGPAWCSQAPITISKILSYVWLSAFSFGIVDASHFPYRRPTEWSWFVRTQFPNSKAWGVRGYEKPHTVRLFSIFGKFIGHWVELKTWEVFSVCTVFLRCCRQYLCSFLMIFWNQKLILSLVAEGGVELFSLSKDSEWHWFFKFHISL